MENSNFHSLLDRYLTGDLTASEKLELASMVDIPENQAVLEQFVENIMVSGKYADDFSSDSNIKERLFASLNDPNLTLEKPGRPVHRTHFLKTAWFRYAAAVVLALGVGTIAYLWTTNNKTEQTLANGNKQLQTDVAPGGEKAVLTLADGSKIVLDNAANGQLAVQQGSKVVKKDGQIIYDPENISARNVVYNTMSTPRGGQYKLTLPDGTKVWLNAATTITYPIAFVGKERKVKINGEAYFEVTKNKEKPFVVDIDGKSSVEVLGTSFNINSYVDESTIKTTLLEGSVRVSNINTTAVAASSDRQPKSNETSVVLKQGQQANQPVQALGSIQIINNANIDQALAWKNGLFSFDDADLRSVMRQLERWYDIKVKYEGSVSDISLKGEMYRNVSLSTVLNFLQKMGVKFKLEGKTLIVIG